MPIGIAKHVAGAPGLDILHGIKKKLLAGYSAAEYARGVVRRGGTSGYVFRTGIFYVLTLHMRAVPWRSKLQRAAAPYSPETTAVSASTAAKENLCGWQR